MIIDTKLLRELAKQYYNQKSSEVENKITDDRRAIALLTRIEMVVERIGEAIVEVENIAKRFDYNAHDFRCVHGVPVKDGSVCAQCKGGGE